MSSYGTSIEESEGKSELARARHVQKNSGISIWKDQVLDDNGKRRLHGAFKGGWHAGYGNTCGSLEGWTPSTFVS
eukprot:CAMPEP_0201493314 /NCGR_PEP_ID=MMETSP0151_2-20130828/37258_1 /ASSEMBLY_ACC=CAM_ASM_000257 /TAXON_ID=200890 /ORGANISM="Paramoeba atlantica, Strain 621/1 / CCAP 1560/9" /LENGTH=74 /DNA_ID=CAMNT_0047880619 /DNA_START=25 /DNA_END=245 /DNA_ORIENTATION=-